MNDAKSFPIQAEYVDENGKKLKPQHHKQVSAIPWWLAEEAFKEYKRRYMSGQSLERLAERGGFGRYELLDLLRNRK